MVLEADLAGRYIGSEKAIADLPFFNGNVASGGGAAMLFWRSAYIVSHLPPLLHVRVRQRELLMVRLPVDPVLREKQNFGDGGLVKGQAVRTVRCGQCV